ncbi:TIGR03751 family conjugal transfer lipoprotein [Scandinavium sp. M-37]|uniref:TIGR03751 family conjugal transfer lipoprotein n=1 Tax=Scandinavium sp. M-37 TaxID=3373077 RepID=UPI003745105F
MKILCKFPFCFSTFFIVCVITGCSTSQETLLPVDENTTMLSLWGRQTGGAQALYDARQQLRRPVEDISAPEQQRYSRTAENDIYSQFTRLPDPDMVMYVYPHLTSERGIPVPGYSTVFPFYGKVHYALPGERTEAL